MEKVFYATFKTVHGLGRLKHFHLNRVNPDTIVQEKAITFAICQLVGPAVL
jgi:hypothetical protein